MSAPGPHEGAPAAQAGSGPRDVAGSAEQSITAALAGLDELDGLAVGEHVQRFDAVHAALTEALSSAENLLSGSNGNGS